MPDVIGSTATRYDLDVNVEDATSEFLRVATQTNRQGGPRQRGTGAEQETFVEFLGDGLRVTREAGHQRKGWGGWIRI